MDTRRPSGRRHLWWPGFLAYYVAYTAYLVALDIFLAAAVALCVAASLPTGRTVFLDVAVGLALVGFVGTVGWARLIERSANSDVREWGP